jgi:hypothetical protein
VTLAAAAGWTQTISHLHSQAHMNSLSEASVLVERADQKDQDRAGELVGATGWTCIKPPAQSSTYEKSRFERRVLGGSSRLEGPGSKVGGAFWGWEVVGDPPVVGRQQGLLYRHHPQSSVNVNSKAEQGAASDLVTVERGAKVWGEGVGELLQQAGWIPCCPTQQAHM